MSATACEGLLLWASGRHALGSLCSAATSDPSASARLDVKGISACLWGTVRHEVVPTNSGETGRVLGVGDEEDILPVGPLADAASPTFIRDDGDFNWVAFYACRPSTSMLGKPRDVQYPLRGSVVPSPGTACFMAFLVVRRGGSASVLAIQRYRSYFFPRLRRAFLDYLEGAIAGAVSPPATDATPAAKPGSTAL